MADAPDMGEMVRRAVQANAQLYKGILDLSLEYWKNLAGIFGGEETSTSSSGSDDDVVGDVLVMEGDAGATVRAAFLVTNDLGRPLRCDLAATDFKNAQGHNISAAVTFDPPMVELQPGEQRIVHATIPIHDQLDAGVAYNGHFSVKGIDGFSVPVVLRRMHTAEESAST